MTTVNRAVRDHLRRVVDNERRRTARFLVRARVGGALVYLLITAYYGLAEHQVDWRATLLPLAAYTAVAFVIAVLSEFVPRVLSVSGLMVALLDIPGATVISVASIPFMERPAYLLGSLVPFAAVLISMAALSLDFLAIGLATISASIASVVLVWAIDAPISESASPVFACLMAGLLIGFLVSRLRKLVEESRRRDFAGKYIIGERLGVGGMAEVFAATYSPAGGFERQVAVKRILASVAETPDAIALFRREAELGAMLTHPNIVQVLDFGSDGSTYFLAMELIDGVPLQRVLELCRSRNTPMPLPAFVSLALMMCDALDYIHTRRSPDGASLALVHRDVNPPNIMISRLGEVKLGDFGIARVAAQAHLTATGTFRGKLGYAAPEQLVGNEFDGRADLFALGVTLYETLTGQKLFQGTDVSLVKGILQTPIALVSSVRPDAPPLLDALIAGLLTRDVTQRTQSAALAARQLEQLPPNLTDVTMGRRLLGVLVEEAIAVRPLSSQPQHELKPKITPFDDTRPNTL